MSEREEMNALGIENPYLSEQHQLSIYVDHTLNKVFVCEYIGGELDSSNYKHLIEANNILAMKIKTHFDIILAEYGVKINKTKPIIYRG